jgi:hypothetical protein
MTDKIDPDIFIEKDGEQIAQVGVTSTRTYDSGKREYQAYFAIPRDAVGPDLSFAYWGRDMPLEGLIAEAE